MTFNMQKRASAKNWLYSLKKSYHQNGDITYAIITTCNFEPVYNEKCSYCTVSLLLTIKLSMHTVEPVLNGHPWGIAN